MSYFIFKDLCQLTNGEQPYWLHGIVEMTRTFGLELLESVLKGYPNIFLKVKLLLVCSSLGSNNKIHVMFIILFISLQGKNTKKMNGFQIEIWKLSFLRREEKWHSQRITLRVRQRTNNKLNPCMASLPGFKPGPHWWEASTLTMAPALLSVS